MDDATAAFYAGGRALGSVAGHLAMLASRQEKDDPLSEPLAACLVATVAERQGVDLPLVTGQMLAACRLVAATPPSARQRLALQMACVEALRLAFALPNLEVAAEADALCGLASAGQAQEQAHVTWRALARLNQGLIQQYILADWQQALGCYSEASRLMAHPTFDPAFRGSQVELALHLGTGYLLQGNTEEAARLQAELAAGEEWPWHPVMAALLAGRTRLWQAARAVAAGQQQAAAQQVRLAEQAAAQVVAHTARVPAREKAAWLLEAQIMVWFAAEVRQERERAGALLRELARQARQTRCTWLRQWYFTHIIHGAGAGVS